MQSPSGLLPEANLTYLQFSLTFGSCTSVSIYNLYIMYIMSKFHFKLLNLPSNIGRFRSVGITYGTLLKYFCMGLIYKDVGNTI